MQSENTTTWWIGSYQLRQTNSESALWISVRNSLISKQNLFPVDFPTILNYRILNMSLYKFIDGYIMPDICLTLIKGRVTRVYMDLQTLLCHVSRTGTVNSCCRTWGFKKEEKKTYMTLQVRASITGTLEEGSEISSASASESLRFCHAALAQLFIFSPWTFLFSCTQSASAYPPTQSSNYINAEIQLRVTITNHDK